MEQEEYQKHLIFSLGLVSFATSLASIFVSIFLFKNSSLQTTFLYRGISFGLLLVTYTLSGVLLRKFTSGQLVKIGLGLYGLHYFLLLVLQKSAVDYILPLGVISGIASGCFWAGYNTGQYILTAQGKRIEYFANQKVIKSIAQAVAPTLGGGIISLGGFLISPFLGYSLLFLTVAFVFLASLSVNEQLPDFSDFKFTFQAIFKNQRKKKWKFVLLQQFLLGCFDTSMIAVTGILTYVILKSEFWVGAISTLTKGMQMAGNFLAKKALRKNEGYALLGVFGLAAGSLFFAVQQTPLGVIVFSLLSGLAGPFFSLWLSSFYLDTLDDQQGDYKEKYHYLIERDFALGTPRMLSFFFLVYYLGFGDQIQLAKNWLFAIPVFLLTLGGVIFISQQFSEKTV